MRAHRRAVRSANINPRADDRLLDTFERFIGFVTGQIVVLHRRFGEAVRVDDRPVAVSALILDTQGIGKKRDVSLLPWVEAAQDVLRKEGNTATDNLKAYIHATFAEDANTRSVSAALLAAVAYDPQLLAPVHEHQQRDMAELLEHSPQFARAAVVWLATIGLWFLEILEASPLNNEQRQQVMEEMLRLAEAVETPTATTNRE